MARGCLGKDLSRFPLSTSRNARRVCHWRRSGELHPGQRTLLSVGWLHHLHKRAARPLPINRGSAMWSSTGMMKGRRAQGVEPCRRVIEPAGSPDHLRKRAARPPMNGGSAIRSGACLKGSNLPSIAVHTILSGDGARACTARISVRSLFPIKRRSVPGCHPVFHAPFSLKRFSHAGGERHKRATFSEQA